MTRNEKPGSAPHALVLQTCFCLTQPFLLNAMELLAACDCCGNSRSNKQSSNYTYVVKIWAS